MHTQISFLPLQNLNVIIFIKLDCVRHLAQQSAKHQLQISIFLNECLRVLEPCLVLPIPKLLNLILDSEKYPSPNMVQKSTGHIV